MGNRGDRRLRQRPRQRHVGQRLALRGREHELEYLRSFGLFGLWQREGITHAGAICQRIPGAGIDRAVGALLVERMTPVTLEVALRVQAERVQRVRRTYDLKPRCERLRARGLLDLKEMAERLGVTTGTVKKWRDRELLTAHVCNDKGECLYEWPDEPPKPQKRASKASPDMQTPGVPADRSNEVQYEL